MLVRHLADRGVATRPDASVRLRVQVLHRRATFTSQRVSATGGVRSSIEEPIHQLVVWLRFEVTTALLRQDAFHVLRVVPADGYAMRAWTQEREPLAQRLTEQLETSLGEALTSVASNDEPAEPAEWQASNWTAAVSAATHTRFAAALKRGQLERRTFVNLQTQPEIALDIAESARRFISRADVQAMWQAQFERIGLQRRPVTGIYLDHRIFALYDDASTAARIWGIEGMPFYHLSEVLLLNEKDVVYPLEGAYYRSDVQLAAWTWTGFSMVQETKQALDAHVTDRIAEFGTAFLSLR